MQLDKLLHGGDYNPEQWLDRPDILAKDVELMGKAHVNVVTLGVFSWSTIEPQEGEFHLDWLADIIHNLYAHGISTILATPSAARPAWLAQKYPEVRRVRGDRVRELYNRRQNHCYTSPIYREKVAIIDRKLNVAITRARKQMIMTGNPEILRNNQIFSELMNYVKEKGGYF